MTPEEHLRAAFEGLGLLGDPESAEAPRRVAALLAEFAPTAAPTLSICATQSTSPVAMRAIPFYSMCAHHLVPFFGRVDVAYRPDGRLVGFGGIPRLINTLARRTQLQERLTEQIADAIFAEAAPTSVRVAIQARHLCVELHHAGPIEVSTAATRGRDDPDLARLLGGPLG